MLSVYCGYGNSMPGVSMFATSFPFPPTGPPPACVFAGAASVFGASTAGVCFGAVFAFEAGTGVFGAALGGVGAGAGFATGAGVGSGCTAPIARSPAGAAIKRTANTG